MEDIEKKYQAICKESIENESVVGLFLGGSRGKSKDFLTEHSDIDVCVVSPKFTNAWDALSYLRRKVPYGVGWIIEPLGFNPTDFSSKYSSLINEIKTYGVEV
jgi:hypothetical protein